MRLEPEGRSVSRSAFEEGGRYLGIPRNGTFSGLTSVQGTGCGTTARTSSVTDHRESGLPESRGKVQANAVTCARTAEGKKAWTPGPGRVLEGRPRSAPPPPFTDRPIRAAHRPGDGGVAPLRVLIGQEQNLRAHHLRMRSGATACQALELAVLGCRERHLPSRFGSAPATEAPSRCTHPSHDSAGLSMAPKNPVRIHDPVY